jgi:hypothetical protein
MTAGPAGRLTTCLSKAAHHGHLLGAAVVGGAEGIGLSSTPAVLRHRAEVVPHPTGAPAARHQR